jgi:hypothetical protein
MQLSKTAIMWSGEGEKLRYDCPVGFQVEGMLIGKGARIYLSEPASDRWQILPMNSGVDGERYGDFKSADDALAALQTDVSM